MAIQTLSDILRTGDHCSCRNYACESSLRGRCMSVRLSCGMVECDNPVQTATDPASSIWHLLESHHLIDQVQRPLLHLLVNPTNVFADNAQAN